MALVDDYEIVVSNVCCSVHLNCQLDLQKLAEDTWNVELRQRRMTIRLRRPKITANIWSTGKIMCVGAHSEAEARLGARRIARLIQRRGFQVKLRRMRIVNVLACCYYPFRIRIRDFAIRYPETSYEPELFPAASYQIPDLKARLLIHATGNVIIFARTVANVHAAAKYIYPLVEEFRRNLTAADELARAEKVMLAQKRVSYQ